MAATSSAAFELSGLRLLTRRPLLWRADALPFAALYAAALRASYVLDPKFAQSPLLLVLLAHALAMLAQQWSVDLRRRVGFAEAAGEAAATHIFVPAAPARAVADRGDEAPLLPLTPPASAGAIVPLISDEGSEDAVESPLIAKQADAVARRMMRLARRRFEHQSLCYELLPESGLEDDAEPEAGLAPAPAGGGRQAAAAPLPDAMPLAAYSERWRGWSSNEATLVARKFGANRMDVPVPAFLALFQEHAVAPLFVFQVFSVCLWLLDEHPWSSLYTLAMLTMAEAAQVYSRIQTAQNLRGMRPPLQRVWAFRGDPGRRRWIEVGGDELVPLDIVSLSRRQPSRQAQAASPQPQPQLQPQQLALLVGSHCPADVLLLSGSVVVNEAMLTGESTPQMKEAADTLDAEDFAPLDGSGAVVTSGAAPARNGAATPASTFVRAAVRLNAFVADSDRSHARCVVFGGTQLIQHHTGGGGVGAAVAGSSPAAAASKSSARAAALLAIPASPDDGAIAVVLRTGARTSQGELMRTIMHALEPGSVSDRGEAYVFLLGLLVCALAASAYVMRVGLADPARDRWELVLHCVMLITIVVPPELPITLSMAVNNSMAALRKIQVFCTDPARIPLAGKVTTCAFDKTGTLTSDEFVVEGVIVLAAGAGDGGGGQPMLAAASAPAAAKLVVSGCHALMAMAVTAPPQPPPPPLAATSGGQRALQAVTPVAPPAGPSIELLGDPVEKAALRAIGWTIDEAGVARPAATSLSSSLLSPSAQAAPPSVRVLRRWAFSSALKRMTALVRTQGSFFAALGGGAGGASEPQMWVVTKGAPEVVELLIDPLALPRDYRAVHERLSARGSRVLALAYKAADRALAAAGAAAVERGQAERGLLFAGFLAVSSPLKTDSRRAIAELQASGHRVIMITGDAPLTALAVSRKLNLGESGDASTPPAAAGANLILDDTEQGSRAATAAAALAIAPPGALVCVTGRFLEAFDRAHAVAETARLVRRVAVFARTSPSQKERIVALLSDHCGEVVAMVGDGSNDTGALKRAHVGLAVVSNPALERRWDVARIRARQQHDEVVAKAEAEAASAPSGSLRWAAAQATLAKLRAHATEGDAAAVAAVLRETDEEDARALASQAQAHTQTQTLAAGGSAAHASVPTPTLLQRKLAELEAELKADGGGAGGAGEAPSLGDASMAAPFTSKIPTPQALVDVLRQGRCTLVVTHQSFKIMAVSSLVFCYMYSVLYINGVKLADEQHMAAGICMSVFNMLVSFAKPVARLSRERPHASALNRGLLASVACQFAIHLAAMLAVSQLVGTAEVEALETAARAAKLAAAAAAAGAAGVAGAVTDAVGVAADATLDAAQQLLQSKLADAVAGVGSDSTAGGWFSAPAAAAGPAAGDGGLFAPTTPFVPTRLVSAVFLVSTAAQACTYLVSYRGEPFMEPLTPASFLGRGALGLYLVASAAALGLSKDLNELLKLVPLETQGERLALLALILGDGALCFAVEGALRRVFAGHRPTGN